MYIVLLTIVMYTNIHVVQYNIQYTCRYSTINYCNVHAHTCTCTCSTVQYIATHVHVHVVLFIILL